MAANNEAGMARKNNSVKRVEMTGGPSSVPSELQPVVDYARTLPPPSELHARLVAELNPKRKDAAQGFSWLGMITLALISLILIVGTLGIDRATKAYRALAERLDSIATQVANIPTFTPTITPTATSTFTPTPTSTPTLVPSNLARIQVDAESSVAQIGDRIRVVVQLIDQSNQPFRSPTTMTFSAQLGKLEAQGQPPASSIIVTVSEGRVNLTFAPETPGNAAIRAEAKDYNISGTSQPIEIQPKPELLVEVTVEPKSISLSEAATVTITVKAADGQPLAPTGITLRADPDVLNFSPPNPSLPVAGPVTATVTVKQEVDKDTPVSIFAEVEGVKGPGTASLTVTSALVTYKLLDESHLTASDIKNPPPGDLKDNKEYAVIMGMAAGTPVTAAKSLPTVADKNFLVPVRVMAFVNEACYDPATKTLKQCGIKPRLGGDAPSSSREYEWGGRAAGYPVLSAEEVNDGWVKVVLEGQVRKARLVADTATSSCSQPHCTYAHAGEYASPYIG